MGKTSVKGTITSQMVEDVWGELLPKINDVVYRAASDMPHKVFQEVHTTGFLWWKHTYYVYYRYFEGSMLPVSVYSENTVKELEK